MADPQFPFFRFSRKRTLFWSSVVIPVFALWLVHEHILLAAHLQLAADETLKRRDPKEPPTNLELAMEAMSVFSLKVDDIERLKSYSPRQLTRHLLYDPSPRRRAIAAAALVSVDRDHLMEWSGIGESVVHAVANDSDPLVRLIAKQVLSSTALPTVEMMKALRAAEQLPAGKLGDIVVALDQHSLVRFESSFVESKLLREVGRASADASTKGIRRNRSPRLEALIQKVATEGIPEFRIWAIAQMGPLNPVIDQAEISADDVRKYVRSMFDIPSMSALRLVGSQLSGFELHGRLNETVMSLPHFQDELAAQIRAATQDENVSVRLMALDAIDVYRGDKDLSTDVLLALLNDTNQQVVQVAIDRVRRRGGIPAGPAVEAKIRELTSRQEANPSRPIQRAPENTAPLE